MKGKIIGGSAAAVIALAATALVKPWEGYSPTPYVDMVGVVTHCYGDTSKPQKVRYTQSECNEKLNTTLAAYYRSVSACINVPLRENEWAAVLSWTYNVGTTAACNSTLVRKINAGQPAAEWCPELDRWVYAGGRRIKGLANRRADERRLCEDRP